MKVLYDYQKFSTQKVGGITRYFAELFNAFSDNVVPYVSIRFNRNLYISGREDLFLHKVRDFDFNFRGRKFALAAVERLNRWCAMADLRNADYDIFHPTYYDTYYERAGIRAPVVVTVHDMIQELWPDVFGSRIIGLKKSQIFGSDHIVAVSENTKKDILNIYPEISPSKISVIYHGVSLHGVRPSDRPLPEKFILFVGKRDGYKNFIPLISALCPLFKADRELKLLCAGEKFKPYEITFLNENGLSDSVIQVDADDSMLLAMYSKARLFVFPSLYEGFGLPILEAFSAGCPVCLSDASCFPEIAEDAAVYFDPMDGDSILDAVGRCLSDEELRNKVIRKGRGRLGAFDWKRSAHSLENVYAGLL